MACHCCCLAAPAVLPLLPLHDGQRGLYLAGKARVCLATSYCLGGGAAGQSCRRQPPPLGRRQPPPALPASPSLASQLSAGDGVHGLGQAPDVVAVNAGHADAAVAGHVDVVLGSQGVHHLGGHAAVRKLRRAGAGEGGKLRGGGRGMMMCAAAGGRGGGG